MKKAVMLCNRCKFVDFMVSAKPQVIRTLDERIVSKKTVASGTSDCSTVEFYEKRPIGASLAESIINRYSMWC